MASRAKDLVDLALARIDDLVGYGLLRPLFGQVRGPDLLNVELVGNLPGDARIVLPRLLGRLAQLLLVLGVSELGRAVSATKRQRVSFRDI
jgi:hypothetical protein